MSKNRCEWPRACGERRGVGLGGYCNQVRSI